MPNSKMKEVIASSALDGNPDPDLPQLARIGEESMFRTLQSEARLDWKYHFDHRDREYRDLIKKHQEQDNEIKLLTKNLGVMSGSGTSTDVLCILSAVFTAGFPLLSTIADWQKELVGTSMVFGGIIAGVAIPLIKIVNHFKKEK